MELSKIEDMTPDEINREIEIRRGGVWHEDVEEIENDGTHPLHSTLCSCGTINCQEPNPNYFTDPVSLLRVMEARKALTEFLGECWHDFPPQTGDKSVTHCLKCGHEACDHDDVPLPKVGNLRTFDTIISMQQLVKRLDQVGWWPDFFNFSIEQYVDGESGPFGFAEMDTFRLWLYDPQSFCERVYEFLQKMDYEARESIQEEKQSDD